MKTTTLTFKGSLAILLMAGLMALMVQKASAQGTWTPVTNLSPQSGGGVMILLSDGTVMAKTGGGTGNGTIWTKLTPDIHGSYINGTWTSLAPMIHDRLYFSTEMLKDGRVYVAGGEDGSGGSFSEIYDPVSDTWTELPNTGNTFSDANSEILSNGKVLQSAVEGSQTSTFLYDPLTNQYTATGSTNGSFNESAWLKLPDNSILYVDKGSRTSERYIPSLGQWIVDSNLPVDLYDVTGDETGPAFLLPDGRGFFLGATGHTAYYTPSGNNNPGTWSAGPDIPNLLSAPDAPGAMMANGKILCAVSTQGTSTNEFPPPTSFYEFNYLTNSFTLVSTPDGAATEGYPAFVATMLNLPDGTILYSTLGNTQYFVYTPSGTALAAGKPTVQNIVAAGNGCTYTATGTLFNGISEGSSYGDDWQMFSNYPVIRLTNGSNVYYARTYNWNSRGVQRGTAPDSVQFTLPAGLPLATYSLVVTANGISSNPVSFTPASCHNVVPTVAMTGPANNSTFNAIADITLSASAADSDGSVSIVLFYAGSTFIGSDISAPYTYDWSGVLEGTYSVTAVARDNSGATTTSAPITVIVKAIADLTGPDCASPNSSIAYILADSRTVNATSYDWWFTGYTQSISPVGVAPFVVNIQTGPYFTGGQVCVGVQYNGPPYYASFCKTVSVCSGARLAANSTSNQTSNVDVISPNPSSDYFTLNAKADVESVVIINELGQQVYKSGKVSEGASINMGNDLKSGVYMSIINYSDGTGETKRIVKQ